MAELTDEQFRKAHRLLLDNGYAATGTLMKLLAPLLQLPWDEPTGVEVTAASKTTFSTGLPSEVLKEFIRNRNAALLPKPVDPRREKVLSVMKDRVFGCPITPEEAADAVIEALNEVEQ